MPLSPLRTHRPPIFGKFTPVADFKKHLPPPTVHKYNLRMRPHNLTLPPKDDRNFIARQLYKNIY